MNGSELTWKSPARSPLKWLVYQNGQKVAEASSDTDTVHICGLLHAEEPDTRIEVRNETTGVLRLWHPDYPEQRSLGLWEDRLREYEPLRQTLDWVRDATNRAAVLAGGCIRDFMVFENAEQIKDFDLFVLDVAPADDKALLEHLDAAVGRVGTQWTEPDFIRYLHVTPSNRLLMDVPLPWLPAGKVAQVIVSAAKTPGELIARFDWTACKFWYDGNLIGADGMTDFVNRELSLNHVEGKSLMRILERGFNLQRKLRRSPVPLTLPEHQVMALADLMQLEPQLEEQRGERDALDL